MDKTNGEDLAFPLRYTEGTVTTTCEGLTKREYFAAMAMQGFLENRHINSEHNIKEVDMRVRWVVTDAVIAADALIAELNKDTK